MNNGDIILENMFVNIFDKFPDKEFLNDKMIENYNKYKKLIKNHCGKCIYYDIVGCNAPFGYLLNNFNNDTDCIILKVSLIK